MGEGKREVWEKRTSSIESTEIYRKRGNLDTSIQQREGQLTDSTRCQQRRMGSEYESDVVDVDALLCSALL